ncbi:MAG: hypothetical protein ABJJ82_07395, partial [Marinobacter sp.]
KAGWARTTYCFYHFPEFYHFSPQSYAGQGRETLETQIMAHHHEKAGRPFIAGQHSYFEYVRREHF